MLQLSAVSRLRKHALDLLDFRCGKLLTSEPYAIVGASDSQRRLELKFTGKLQRR